MLLSDDIVYTRYLAIAGNGKTLFYQMSRVPLNNGFRANAETKKRAESMRKI